MAATGPIPICLGSTPVSYDQYNLNDVKNLVRRTNNSTSNPFSNDPHAFLLCACPRCKNAKRCPITDATGISSCSRRRTPVREDRFQSGQTLLGHPRTDSIVYGDDNTTGLDRQDLLCKYTACESLCKSVLISPCVSIYLRPYCT